MTWHSRGQGNSAEDREIHQTAVTHFRLEIHWISQYPEGKTQTKSPPRVKCQRIEESSHNGTEMCKNPLN